MLGTIASSGAWTSTAPPAAATAAAPAAPSFSEPDAVLLRPAVEPDVARLDEQVPVGRRDVDVPRAQPLARHRLAHRHAGLAGDDLGQQAVRGGRDVEHDAGGRGQVLGQLAHEALERVDAACRGADRDDAPRVQPIVRSHTA
jgi:hypothetical protein